MFDKRFYPHLWLLIIYIPFVFIVKEFLPQNAARENGPIENFQLVLLAVGIYLCWQGMKKTRGSMDKYIWQAGMLFYILVFGRELSWGRALLMQSDGTMPKWRELGIWGDIAHPLIGLFIVLVDISEHYNCSIFHGEIDEELFECAMYFEMLRVTEYVKNHKMT